MLAIALIAYLGFTIYQRWQEVRDYQLSFVPIIFSLSLLILLFFYLLFGFTWQRILTWLSKIPKKIASLVLFRIFFTSLLTRYLPAGKIINIGTRIELLHRQGESRILGGESVVYEQLYFVGTALLLLWGAMLGKPHASLPDWYSRLQLLIFFGGFLFLLVLIVVPGKLLTLLFRKFHTLDSSGVNPSIEFGQRLELTLRMVVINLLQGAAAGSLLWSVFPNLWMEGIPLLWVFIAYPVSRFIGQAVLVIPGGIGIREGLFAMILSPYIPVQPLLITAGIMRLISIMMELILLVIVSGLSWFKNRDVTSIPTG